MTTKKDKPPVAIEPVDKDEVTQPEVPEVYDDGRILRTMAQQVSILYKELPSLLATVKAVAQQQVEHERRIIRLEGHVQTLLERGGGEDREIATGD
jgi:hypothetical protein